MNVIGISFSIMYYFQNFSGQLTKPDTKKMDHALIGMDPIYLAIHDWHQQMAKSNMV